MASPDAPTAALLAVARSPLGARTGFGEVAVVRAVPRSATVVARTKAETYRIDARDVVTVLRGHPASWDCADGRRRSDLAADRSRAEGSTRVAL